MYSATGIAITSSCVGIEQIEGGGSMLTLDLLGCRFGFRRVICCLPRGQLSECAQIDGAFSWLLTRFLHSLAFLRSAGCLLPSRAPRNAIRADRIAQASVNYSAMRCRSRVHRSAFLQPAMHRRIYNE